LIITSRPDLKPVWVNYGHVTFLTLSRLPRRQSIELLASMTGGKAFPLEVERAILAKTDGIPLYIEELTKNLLESGLLTEEEDSYSLKSPLRDLSIPDSLQALLMERIDRLGPAKEIVQMGASIGREFSYELLRETVDINEGELKNALHLLPASGLVFQEGDIPAAKYLFKHALIQDAAYSTLPKKSRRVFHARIAKALESRFAERVKTEPELLAYHYEQAGEINSAVHYWHLAAHRDALRESSRFRAVFFLYLGTMGLSSGPRTSGQGVHLGGRSPLVGNSPGQPGFAHSSSRKCGVHLFLSWPI
jgi:predicted ATPase